MKTSLPTLYTKSSGSKSKSKTIRELAIETSKELIETVCKTILADRNVTFDRKWELMELVKRSREELKLVPDDVPDSAKAADTIRKQLGNLRMNIETSGLAMNGFDLLRLRLSAY
jgi:hypothetical protein